MTGLNDLTAVNSVLTGFAEGAFTLLLAVIDNAGVTAIDTVSAPGFSSTW